MNFQYCLPKECADCVEESAAEFSFEKCLCYRVGKSNSPMQESFVPQYFNGKKKRNNIEACHLCGASVFTTVEDAITCKERYQALGDCILEGEVYPSIAGPLLPTKYCPRKNTGKKWHEVHMDWYQLDGINPEQIFAICE